MDPNAISNNLSSTASTNRTAGNTLLGTDAAQNADLLGRLRGTIGGQETYQDMYKRIGGSLGLPTLQNNANTLNTTFANIPQTYTQGTKGYDVNSNQLSQIIGRKSYEMQPAVTSANNAVANAQNQTSTQIGYEQAQQQKELAPYQTEQQLLADQQARSATMFTTENQQELDGLLAKLQAGVTMSEGEKNRVNQLAVAEKQYQAALAGANATVNAAKLGNQNYVIPAGSSIYNALTGKSQTY